MPDEEDDSNDEFTIKAAENIDVAFPDDKDAGDDDKVVTFVVIW